MSHRVHILLPLILLLLTSVWNTQAQPTPTSAPEGQISRTIETPSWQDLGMTDIIAVSGQFCNEAPTSLRLPNSQSSASHNSNSASATFRTLSHRKAANSSCLLLNSRHIYRLRSLRL